MWHHNKIYEGNHNYPERLSKKAPLYLMMRMFLYPPPLFPSDLLQILHILILNWSCQSMLYEVHHCYQVPERQINLHHLLPLFPIAIQYLSILHTLEIHLWNQSKLYEVCHESQGLWMCTDPRFLHSQQFESPMQNQSSEHT